MIAILLSSLFAIWRCQPDTDSAFIYLEAQAAELIIIGLLAQFREFGSIGQQPLFQFCVVGVDLCSGVFGIVKNFRDFLLESFLKEMDSVVGSEAYQQFLAGHLCNIIDLYSIYAVHFARAMKKADEVATDEGLKESLIRYAIESGVIVEQVYQKEMGPIIEDMKRYMDGLLHIYDKGKGGNLTSEMFRLPLEARTRLEESND